MMYTICVLPGWCRSLDSLLSSWNDPTAEAAPAAGSTAPKGVNTAVAAIATLYGDKCKPAHDAASHACQAVEGTQQALTSYMRQGGNPQSGLSVLADLQVAELRMPSNSYRCVALLGCLMLQWLRKSATLLLWFLTCTNACPDVAGSGSCAESLLYVQDCICWPRLLALLETGSLKMMHPYCLLPQSSPACRSCCGSSDSTAEQSF